MCVSWDVLLYREKALFAVTLNDTRATTFRIAVRVFF